MAASLQAAAATLMQPTKLHSTQLRSAPQISKAFGVDVSSGSRLTCSLQSDFKDFAVKCADAGKIAGLALATSALLATVDITQPLLLINY